VISKKNKFYKKLEKSAKFCNLFSILGSPNAESYCTNLNETGDEHDEDIYGKAGVKVKFEVDTRLVHVELKIERWLNSERVKKYFNISYSQKFFAVNPIVFRQVSLSGTRVMATDAVNAALLNRDIGVNYITGSLARTANWIGNLMSATRLKWVGQEDFHKNHWRLWNRKNDLKENGPLKFARVFGRSYNFWQRDMTEVMKFINVYVLKAEKTMEEKEG